MPYLDTVALKLNTDAYLQLNIAQTIFGNSVIDGANYDPQIMINKDPKSSDTVNIAISFDVDNASISGTTQESEKLIVNESTLELKLTPTFEDNDTVIRFGLSFKVETI
jgi:hypothetical protein